VVAAVASFFQGYIVTLIRPRLLRSSIPAALPQRHRSLERNRMIGRIEPQPFNAAARGRRRAKRRVGILVGILPNLQKYLLTFQLVKACLRIRAKNPQIADQIAVNYRKADITPRQRAMLDFAMKVSTEAHGISEADFSAVASHGFSDDDIWDIAAISAFFALSNRMANVTGMRPNDEFYIMGRLPK
jgi:hypothetical protein